MAELRAALTAAALLAAVALPHSAAVSQPAAAPGAAAVPQPPTVDEATAHYVKESARQDQAAIEASRLVLERSARAPVREAAKKVLDERMKAQHRLTTAASVQSLGVRPDKAAQESGEAEVAALRSTAPEGVDRAYLRMAIENHEATLKLQESYGRDGANDALRSHAMAAAILLEARIDNLRRLAAELDGAS